MKKFTMLAAVMLAFVSAIAYASPMVFPGAGEVGINVNYQVQQAQKLELRLSNLGLKSTHVMIEDLRTGDTFYSENVARRNGYAKLLDLSQLPEGKYRLVVKQKGQELIQVLSVKNGTLFASKFVSK
ncbi:MAG: hypothetical protein HUU34_22985 [Saprospiraceae bacterium]|jgi:hypothetical protein|nr:hypothetical protein [Saprospiraceae bacterium]